MNNLLQAPKVGHNLVVSLEIDYKGEVDRNDDKGVYIDFKQHDIISALK